MRYPVSRGNLVMAIQDHMDSAAERVSDMPEGRVKDRFRERLDGMSDLAKGLGFQCDCFRSEWMARPRLVCRCLPSLKSLERKDLSGAGSRRKRLQKRRAV
jgi:hypothetical protein